MSQTVEIKEVFGIDGTGYQVHVNGNYERYFSKFEDAKREYDKFVANLRNPAYGTVKTVEFFTDTPLADIIGEAITEPEQLDPNNLPHVGYSE